MPKSDVNVEEPANAEEVIEETKKSTRATFEKFKAKKRIERKVPLEINGEEMELLFRAIGSTEYDKLIAKCPPTYEQKANGSTYNVDTFGPIILDKVCIDPDMTVEQWTEIWNSPNWNRGEIMQMFYIATELCNRGFDIPFNENG
jgi:hypothetical protein